MSGKIRVWSCVIASSFASDARTRDGRSVFQVKGRIATTTKAKAARALGMSLHEFNQYATEALLRDDDLDHVDVVRIEPNTKGDTIGGTEGLRVADPQPTPYQVTPRGQMRSGRRR